MQLYIIYKKSVYFVWSCINSGVQTNKATENPCKGNRSSLKWSEYKMFILYCTRESTIRAYTCTQSTDT